MSEKTVVLRWIFFMQLKIYSGGVMEKALIQFTLINLKQRLSRTRGRREEGQNAAALIHNHSK